MVQAMRSQTLALRVRGRLAALPGATQAPQASSSRITGVSMHSTTEPLRASNGNMVAPAGAVAGLLSDLSGLVERTGRLIQNAALHLGLDAQGAALAGQTATLHADGRTLVILPMGQSDDGTLSLLLSVQTGLPVQTGSGGGDATAVLQHVPGALHAFCASMGATPDGCWVLYRSLRVAPNDALGLAADLVETVRLAEFVWPDAPPSGH
jgi:hypothetical protein